VCQERGARNQAGSQGLRALAYSIQERKPFACFRKSLEDKGFIPFQITSGFQEFCTETEAKWHTEN